MKRAKIAPTVQHLLRGRMALGKKRSPLRDELRALLAVARAAQDYKNREGIVYFARGKEIREGKRLIRALERLARASGLPKAKNKQAKREEHGLPPPGSGDPDWTRKCEVCRATPILPVTGMCGPCTFGEADTAGGNW